MENGPLPEHLWLQKLLGEWTNEGEMKMKPEDEPITSTGIETVRSLGDFWIVAEGEGEMPGCGMMKTMMTLGYDAAKKRFVGSWACSEASNMWVYDGSLDAGGNILTLDTVGPSFSGDGSSAQFQDIIEIKSADHRTLSSQFLGADGKWQRFMTANYRRRP